ncbi:GntR family transcriptional regulator [Hyphomonas sp.]|uniref:GntR family transcriptional regulator n=1 Tax=Hyphomonas sp. TaxID=87 RepID=UPI001BCAA73B|nr:GntR family transcriptional regulator [Hyphomonas sp.]
MDIILGILPPNARLDELGLADQYILGVAGVRDALARLSLEGVVLRRPRSGTIVTSIDVQEGQQSYEVGCLLEPHAAQQATAAEKEAIRTAFDGADAAAR